MLEPIFFTKTEEVNDTYGKFVFGPLHPSFGQSIGNALRRTLLSMLKGAAVGQVRIDGAPHLFSTIKGVKESGLEIVMNFKQLRFDTTREGTFRVSLSSKGKGKLYGRDVQGEANVVNKDLYIAELTDDKAKFDLEAIIETGYGYVPAEEKEQTDAGYIAIDSSFSPVKQVNFKVEEERVGRKSNFEKLTLEVWTDGSITPQKAVEEAVDILKRYFEHLFSGKDVQESRTPAAVETAKQDEKNAKLEDIIIDELNLPSRVINALLRENIETVADLLRVGRDKLANMKGVGKKSIDLIDAEFKKMNLELK